MDYRAAIPSLLVALAVLSVCTSHAAFPLIVDDAAIHAPSERELDLAANALRTPATESLGADFSIITGLGQRLEGSLNFGYGWTRPRLPEGAPTRDGVLDLNVGLKSAILTGDATPFALTLSATVKLPTASARLGLGTGFTDLSLLAIATRTWGALSLDLNAGFTWTAVGRRAEHAGDGWFSGAALRWQASKPLALFAETFATLPADAGSSAVGTVRAGWQLAVRPAVLLVGAVGTGCGRGAVEAAGTLGVAINF